MTNIVILKQLIIKEKDNNFEYYYKYIIIAFNSSYKFVLLTISKSKVLESTL